MSQLEVPNPPPPHVGLASLVKTLLMDLTALINDYSHNLGINLGQALIFQIKRPTVEY